MKITNLNKGLIEWSRKIHLYIGLCLLFFIMLFGFSGLLLNHHWEFAKFWENRKEIKYDKTIQISGEREQTALVNEIVDILQLHGNIINPGYSEDSILLSFIVAKPGTRYDIQAHLNDGKILITEAKFNSFGTMRNLHTLRNPTPKENGERQQSAWASIWSVSIDIVSVGLISFSAGLIICMYLLIL